MFYQLGTRLRTLGSMFSTNLREALSVSSSARMMPQDRNDVTKFSRKNATFLWENCAKIFGETRQLPCFFFCQVPPFDSNSLQVIVSLLLFQEGQRLF